ncbi:MAG TPA: HAMP domain-containing sensor histidine kinase [Acidimicrobiales bacterium]|nr:HAMP domain-containing sensor histidine kinase [Acidimicrobiales bacterium]
MSTTTGTGLIRRTRAGRSHRPPPEAPEARPGPAEDGAGEPGRPARRRRARPPSLTRRHRHLGLRMRITITFALGAAVLSGALATITYYSVRSSVLSQQTNSLLHETTASAYLLKPALTAGTLQYARWLQDTQSSDASESLLYHHHRWYATAVAFSPPSPIPPALQQVVTHGGDAAQTIVVNGTPTYAVGVWIAPVRSAYFELFPLTTVLRTLHVLLASLLLSALVVTLAGALLGSWAASRALRPLHETAKAALDIAGGRLDTRLETDEYSDLAVLTSSFNRMADRLQERIEREISFTSDVNHELRSPLTTLAASLAVLEGRRDELPERSRRALDLLSAEVRRFRRLVDDLLEISRLDAGLSDLSMTEVPLGDLVRRSVAATSRPVPIHLGPGAEDGRVLVDKRRFERIVANLLDNAQHYAGGATDVVVSVDGPFARISVEDEGPGIPPEERERIFDRFSRGSSGRRRGLGEGTGLGLAIAAEHTRVLGGRIWVEANGSRGARFVVELPLHRDGAL